MGGDDFSAYLAEAPAATRSSAPARGGRRTRTTTRASHRRARAGDRHALHVDVALRALEGVSS
jgi:hypothetical protein